MILSRLSNHSGIAIGPILFLIAIVAILATAISAGNSSFTNGSAQESARMYAQTLITQGNAVKNIVERLIGTGCTDTQLNFSNAALTPAWTNNPNSPADLSCHVFKNDAGLYPYIPTGALDSAQGGGNFGLWLFTGNNGVLNIGSGPLNVASAMELMMYVQNVRQDVCTQINLLLNIPTIINNGPNFSPGSTFLGSYGASGQLSNASFSGQLRGCFYSTTVGQNTYVYYQVLVPR